MGNPIPERWTEWWNGSTKPRNWLWNSGEYQQQHEASQRSRTAGATRSYVTDALEETQARLHNQFGALTDLLALPIRYTGSNADEVLNHIIKAVAPSSAGRTRYDRS